MLLRARFEGLVVQRSINEKPQRDKLLGLFLLALSSGVIPELKRDRKSEHNLSHRNYTR